MMNLKSLALIVGLTCMGVQFATAQFIHIESKNGASSAINLLDIESIVFENNNMVVNTIDCGENYFSVSYSEQLTFEETTTDVDEVETLSLMSIYPNPVSNTLTIDSRSTEILDARIFNANGIILKSIVLHGQRNEIDIKDLSSGMYFIMIDDQIEKFIKQ